MAWWELLTWILLSFYLKMTLPCPVTELEWIEKNDSFNCPLGEYYHCFCSENGQSDEACRVPRLMNPNECVEGFNENLNSFNIVNCSGDNCPQEIYRSFLGYKYATCRRIVYDEKGCTTATSYSSYKSGLGETTNSLYIIHDPTSSITSRNIITTPGAQGFSLSDLSTIGFALIFGLVLLSSSVVIYYRRKKSRQTIKKQTEPVETQVPARDRLNEYDDSWEMREFTRVVRNNQIGTDNTFEDDIYDHLKSKRVNLDEIITDDNF